MPAVGFLKLHQTQAINVAFGLHVFFTVHHNQSIIFVVTTRSWLSQTKQIALPEIQSYLHWHLYHKLYFWHQRHV